MTGFRRTLATVARFAINTEAAEKCFCDFHRARILSPGTLKRSAKVGRRITRTWIPFWLFDAHVSARFVAEVGWSQPRTQWDPRFGRWEVHWSTFWKSVDEWHVLEGVHNGDHPRMQVCATYSYHPFYVEAAKGPFANRTIELDPREASDVEWEPFNIRKETAWEACYHKLEQRYLQRAEEELKGLYQAHAVRNLRLELKFWNRNARAVYFPAYVFRFHQLNAEFMAIVGGITGKVGSESFYSPYKVAMLAVVGMSFLLGPGLPVNVASLVMQAFVYGPSAMAIGWVASRWPIFMAQQRRMQVAAGGQEQQEYNQEWEWQRRHNRYEKQWEERQKTQNQRFKNASGRQTRSFDPKGYYRTLGLPRSGNSVTIEEVKKAFRHVAFQKHPDREKDPAAKKKREEEFKHILEAYHVLRDPDKKREYDLTFE